MISALLGLRMRDRREMDEVLVIEELVLLGRHEMAVEAEQLAERHAVVHLDRLERRAGTARTARAERTKNPQSSVRYSVISPGRDVAARRRRRLPSGILASRDGSPGTCVRSRLQRAFERAEQPLGLRRVVGRELQT